MVHTHVLWLPSWYPNKQDPFDGDFIQRHAHAAAVENKVHVLFVKAIDQKEHHKQEICQSGHLTEQIIYIKKEHRFLKKAIRQWQWFRQYKTAIQEYINSNGLPQLVHVHVPWRAGLIALWMKRKYNVKFLITEHWDIYNQVVANRFTRQPWWKQKLIKRIFSEATLLVPVSHFIAKAIARYVVPKEHRVILNVVDTDLFTYRPFDTKPFVFLHVSNMVPKKNITGILEAFLLFQQIYASAQLVLVGNKDDQYEREAARLKIPRERIVFRGEIVYRAVAEEMQGAHCLIVNSLIENSPCVIGEALSSGIPVIATKVGGIPEIVNESNSILIPPNNTNALLEAMQDVYEDFKKFNRPKIADSAAKKFGKTAIAHQFTRLYESVADGS